MKHSNYLESRQFDLDQELAAERAAGYGTRICPRCGGNPEADEDGNWYTCFYCCNTGSVSAEVADAEERRERDFAEQFRPVHLGVYLDIRSTRAYDGSDGMGGGDPYGPDWDDEFGPIARAPGHRLFTRLIPAPRPAPVIDLCDDDIPF